MSKIKAPLFSLDATGTLDKNITYKGKHQNHIAQKYSKPGNINPFESSPRQKDQRSIIRLITIHWQCMSSIDKLSWETAAKDVRFKGTGYHYFLHMAQQNLTQYLGLVGYWSMNYNIDDKIPDLSGNGNHGTLSPTYPGDCPQPIDSFDKKLGRALKFDGVNDYVNCGNGVSLNLTGEITTEALIKITSLTGKDHNIIIRGFDSVEGYRFCIDVSLRIRFDTYSPTKKYSYSSILPEIGKWYYVAATRKGTSARVYSNGVDVTVYDPVHGDPISSTRTLKIGIYDNLANHEFKGLIDEVRIYNRALSPEEIEKHYQSYQI